MASSPGNPNQPGGTVSGTGTGTGTGTGPFDIHKFFKPLNQTNPNPQNPTLISSPFPPPNASYPPPTATGAGAGAGPGGVYPYPPQTTTPFHHHPQFSHHMPQYTTTHDAQLMHQQRSMSFPTPPLQPPPSTSSPHQFPNPNHGARLMALLSAPPSTLEVPVQSTMPMPPIQPTTSGSELSDYSSGPNVGVPHSGPGPLRMPSSKLPKGRHLNGDHIVYDIDVRFPGEVQPQLEVTPITKYGSDPGLVLGRQIAVNKTYICYGLKLGAIRVLNINTALRSLLKGLAQRVTDMAFFAEDVHLLASASVDGRVYIWKIIEGPDEEEKPQITGRIVIALHIVGEGESVHPRVCWHCHKQEILVVGIGKRVLKIDTTKVGKGAVFSADEPIRCPVDKLVDGVQLIGTHDGEVTDLSMCQWMTTRLVSASVDGTIKIWEDRKPLPIAVLRPHDGHPVSSVTFLAGPHRPDHIILITGGPLNREIKIWASASDEGWLLPSDAESWRCTQTLELKSSAEANAEEAFFNQVVALSQAGLLLLANAKKNAIYAVHLEYGPNPEATRMDYIAGFTVTMPILSFTGTSDLWPHGEQVVQVYCVQTQAIQQYALDLSQCLPPPTESVVFERTESGVSRDAASIEGSAAVDPPGSKQQEFPLSSSAPKSSVHEIGSEISPTARHPTSTAPTESTTSQEFASSILETKSSALPSVTSDSDIAPSASPPPPLSPKLSQKLSGIRGPSNSLGADTSDSDQVGNQKVVEYPVDSQKDGAPSNLSEVASLDDEHKMSQDDVPSGISHPVKFKHPTHLVTPSEILMARSSSEVSIVNEQKSESEVNIQDAVTKNGTRNVEMEVKAGGEAKFNQKTDIGSEDLHSFVSENKEKVFCSQISDLGLEMARECRALSPETYTVEESRQFDGVGGSEGPSQSSVTPEENNDSAKDISEKDLDPKMSVTVHHPPAPSGKGKKQKGKNSQVSGPSSSPSAISSTDSPNEAVVVNSSTHSMETAFSQISSMREMLNQVLSMQKETQKQMEMMVAAPVTREVTKEGKRLEAALGRSMEKSVKANSDALWARLQEESAKQDKSLRDRTQQITNSISNFLSKDMPGMMEKLMKKELAAVGQAVARSITPTIEKTISAAISEAFQKGVGDKAVNQLEKAVNSKLEATVARQIQAQFQTSGKQALQETLKSTLEVSVIPAFEMSCKAMFEQVDSTFQKGISDHSVAAQKQFESVHTPLALALRDAINSASAMTQTLSGEFADSQRQLLALVVSGANSPANPLVSHINNGSLLHEKIETPPDPTKELSRLLGEHKYGEAFTAALQRSDVSIVSWLCSQVDLPGILSSHPLPLSQGVLLSLLQQLSCDINTETGQKLNWMRDVLSAINPSDPMIIVHVRPIFEQVYQTLQHRKSVANISPTEASNIRLICHVINSMLMTIK